MAAGQDFDRSKFKELVLYLSRESAEDEGFGMVKLNKLLYRADFEAYRLLGRSITGATYERQEYGPVARELPLALDELAQSGHVIWNRVETGPYTRKVPEAREQPDRTLFAEEELAIVRRTLEELAAYGGKTVSEWSHEESVGWNLVKDGEEIPYNTTFASGKPISPEGLRHAREFALQEDL